MPALHGIIKEKLCALFRGVGSAVLTRVPADCLQLGCPICHEAFGELILVSVINANVFFIAFLLWKRRRTQDQGDGEDHSVS